jgi:hypothetical protein
MNGPYMSYRRGRGLIRILLAVLVAMSVIGVFAYNAGVSHGLASRSARAAPGPTRYPYWPRPWGFGFGFFFPLLFAFLALRLVFGGAFGHRRWHGGRGVLRRGSYDVPPAFDEWHRRAHQRGSEDHPPATSV